MDLYKEMKAVERGLASVIMPAYNAEKYIAKAIASVMQQTYDNVELVIVDDGSTDDTRKCVEQCMGKWPDRIRLFVREENGGTAAALNDAIELAKGTYICWLSADDLYANDMVKSQIQFLTEYTGFDAVFSRCAYIDQDDKFLGELVYEGSPGECIKQGMPGIIALLLHYSFWHGCSLLAKAECFKRKERFNIDYKGAQDYDFWLRLAADHDIGYLDQVNVFSRMHSEQGSRRINCSLDEITVFFNILYREDIIKKLFAKMQIRYTLENIMPYIRFREQEYQGRIDELRLLNAGLKKYISMIENGQIRFEV